MAEIANGKVRSSEDEDAEDRLAEKRAEKERIEFERWQKKTVTNEGVQHHIGIYHERVVKALQMELALVKRRLEDFIAKHDG